MSEEQRFTAKQLRFIAEYCIDFNATQAAIRAGYSPDSAGLIGSENIQKPYIKEAINRRIENINATAGIDALRCLKYRVDIVERCMQAQPVLTSAGEETGEYRFDSAGANKALDAIEKIHLGMADKSVIDHSVAIVYKDDADL